MSATSEILTPLETVKRYYQLIDTGERDDAFQCFNPTAVVRFGDLQPLQGRESIAGTIRTMLALGKAVSHEIIRFYEVAGPDDRTTVICEAVVTYTMLKSGNVISHNAVTISEVDRHGRIATQRNVGDLGPVIADHAQHS